MKSYVMKVETIEGLETLNPVSVEQDYAQSDSKDYKYIPLDEEGLKKVSDMKVGVYWGKDLKSDPNYEVDQSDSEEILKLFYDFGIPLVLM